MATPHKRPYQLTLTANERRAIDWVGNRYAHGDELASVLDCADCMGEEAEWDSPGPITFHLTESQAWTVQEICEEDNLACFGPDLVEKLELFCGRIV